MHSIGRKFSQILALSLAFSAFASAGETREPGKATAAPATRIHRSTDLTLKRGVVRKGNGNAVAMETVEIAHEGLKPFNPTELPVVERVPWKRSTPNNNN